MISRKILLAIRVGLKITTSCNGFVIIIYWLPKRIIPSHHLNRIFICFTLLIRLPSLFLIIYTTVRDNLRIEYLRGCLLIYSSFLMRLSLITVMNVAIFPFRDTLLGVGVCTKVISQCRI